MFLGQTSHQSVISCFHRNVDEICTLLGYYTASSVKIFTLLGYYTASSVKIFTLLGYYTASSGKICTLLGYYTASSVKICTLLRYYTASSGNSLPTVRDKVSVLSLRFKKSNKKSISMRLFKSERS
jgi:hypothetical protein